VKLSSLIESQQIILALTARTLGEAIAEILERAERLKLSESTEDVVAAVHCREAQGCTAMEKGIAMPHARISGLRDFHVLLGIAPEPLETPCLDGSPVDLVFLILANDEKNTLMLKTLAALGSFGLDDATPAALRQAETPEAAWEVIDQSGVRVEKSLHARDLMQEAPIVLRQEMTLRELLDGFFTQGVHEAPVCEESGRVVGCVTSEEIIDAGFPAYMSGIQSLGFLNKYGPFEQFFKREATTLVRDILNPKPLVVDVATPMIQVVFQMKKERERFAYVTEDDQFAGTIDRNDIISRILRA
jgi:nitrogen PTS system EIIA component